MVRHCKTHGQVFIEVVDTDGAKVWINAANIDCVRRTGNQTIVGLVGSNNYIETCTPLEEILCVETPRADK